MVMLLALLAEFAYFYIVTIYNESDDMISVKSQDRVEELYTIVFASKQFLLSKRIYIMWLYFSSENWKGDEAAKVYSVLLILVILHMLISTKYFV